MTDRHPYSASFTVKKYDALDLILRAVLAACNFKQNSITSKCRVEMNVVARQIYCYIARSQTKYSLAAIAKRINRDHATVLYSCKVATIRLNEKVFLEDDKTFSDYYSQTLKKLESWK